MGSSFMNTLNYREAALCFSPTLHPRFFRSIYVIQYSFIYASEGKNLALKRHIRNSTAFSYCNRSWMCPYVLRNTKMTYINPILTLHTILPTFFIVLVTILLTESICFDRTTLTPFSIHTFISIGMLVGHYKKSSRSPVHTVGINNNCSLM